MQPNYFTIPKPCSEDWNKMDGTEQGAFCEQCSKEVVDLTQVKHPLLRMSFAQNQILAYGY